MWVGIFFQLLLQGANATYTQLELIPWKCGNSFRWKNQHLAAVIIFQTIARNMFFFRRVLYKRIFFLSFFFCHDDLKSGCRLNASYIHVNTIIYSKPWHRATILNSLHSRLNTDFVLFFSSTIFAMKSWAYMLHASDIFNRFMLCRGTFQMKRRKNWIVFIYECLFNLVEEKKSKHVNNGSSFSFFKYFFFHSFIWQRNRSFVL